VHILLQGKEVEYSLRAIPLGGYVGFPDDDPDSPYPKDDPDLLRNRPVGQRALVISAGIIANVILAYSVLLAQVSRVHDQGSGFSEQRSSHLNSQNSQQSHTVLRRHHRPRFRPWSQDPKQCFPTIA
jgi:membrane-associated protease RseP (regulator of RpoE activity)